MLRCTAVMPSADAVPPVPRSSAENEADDPLVIGRRQSSKKTAGPPSAVHRPNRMEAALLVRYEWRVATVRYAGETELVQALRDGEEAAFAYLVEASERSRVNSDFRDSRLSGG